MLDATTTPLADTEKTGSAKGYWVGYVSPAFAQHTQLSAVDKAVCLSLLVHRIHGTDRCSIRQETIKYEQGVTERTVRNSLKRLRSLGLVDWDERAALRGEAKGRAHLYNLAGLIALRMVPIKSEGHVLEEGRAETNDTSRPETNDASRPERRGASRKPRSADKTPRRDRKETTPQWDAALLITQGETPETAPASAFGSDARLNPNVDNQSTYQVDKFIGAAPGEPDTVSPASNTFVAMADGGIALKPVPASTPSAFGSGCESSTPSGGSCNKGNLGVVGAAKARIPLGESERAHQERCHRANMYCSVRDCAECYGHDASGADDYHELAATF